MAVSERDRHELYRRLEGVIEKEPADTIMALLPPVGWADVATKDDLRNLEDRLTLRMEALESRIEGRIHSLESGTNGLESSLTGQLGAVESRLRERILKIALAVNIPTIIGTAALVLGAVRIG